MKWSRALIFTTIFSYFTASAAALMGYPANAGIDASIQALIFGVMGLLLSFCAVQDRPQLSASLSIVYGILAALSFSGLQVWIDYSGAGASLGPWMALWDLAMAVALADDF